MGVSAHRDQDGQSSAEMTDWSCSELATARLPDAAKFN